MPSARIMAATAVNRQNTITRSTLFRLLAAMRSRKVWRIAAGLRYARAKTKLGNFSGGWHALHFVQGVTPLQKRHALHFVQGVPTRLGWPIARLEFHLRRLADGRGLALVE